MDSSEKENTEEQDCADDTPPSHFVSVESAQLDDDDDSDGTEPGQEDEVRI